MLTLTETNGERTVKVTPLLLALIYVLTGSLGVFSGGSWAAIGIAGALLSSLVLAWEQKGSFACPNRRTTVALMVLLLIAGMTAVHSLDPGLSFHAFFKLCSIFLPLLLFASPDLQRAGRGALKYLPVWVAVSAVMLGVLSYLLLRDKFLDEKSTLELTKLNRGFSYFVMLLFPFCAYLLHEGKMSKLKGLAMGLLAFAVIVSLCATLSRATQTGCAVAFVAFGFAWIFPTVMIAGLGVLCLGSVAWPWIANYMYSCHYALVHKLPDSWLHRTEIWDYSYYRILERPFWGHGVGSASLVDWSVPHGAMYVIANEAAAHSHNAMVQLWLELGGAGVCSGLLLAALVLHRLWRLPPLLKPYGVAAFAYAYCLLMSAYNLWTDSLWAALMLVCFAFQLVAKSSAFASKANLPRV